MSQTSLTDAKAHLSAYVDNVVRTHERLSLTRNGRRDAVIVAAADLDALEETLSILTDAEFLADVRQGLSEARAGLATTGRPVVGVAL